MKKQVVSNRLGNAAIASICIALAGAAFGCGGDDPSPSTSVDCSTVTCSEGQVCDPLTGDCVAKPADKCGDQVCGANQICDTATNTCVDKPTGECTDGAKKCADDGHEQACKDGKWGEATACADGYSCKSDHCVENTITSDCNDGEKACKSSSEVQTCKDGKWEVSDCGDHESCSEGVCAKDPTECSANEKKCASDAVALICDEDGYWENSPCATGTACDNGECKAQSECEEGAKQCASRDVGQVCQGGQWVDIACKRDGVSDEYCDDKECEIPKCTEDSHVCGENNTAIHCEVGSVPSITKCEDGEVCSDGQCVTFCAEDSITCAGAEQLICEAEKEPVKKACEEGFACAMVDGKGECVEACAEDSIECLEGENARRICVAGQAPRVETCADGLMCSEGSCVEGCAEDYVKCKSESVSIVCQAGNAPIEDTCQSGWACDSTEGSAYEGKCVELCAKDGVTCSAEGLIQTCEAGKLPKFEACD
ncbi:MAG: hypothetical protein II767_03930, partial [Proteobacteria bacterium]|nr:hypothetical protein [Pseudomonadota bacterium]